MKRSAFISDIIFAFCAAFLFTLCLFRYLAIALLPATLLASSCGALAAISIGCFLHSKRTTFFLNKWDETRKEKLLRHLAFLSDEGKTKFFIEVLSTENSPAKRFGPLRIYTASHFYSLKFSYAPVNEDDLLRFARLKTGKEKILLCNKIEESAFILAKKLNIQVWSGKEVYALLKERDALPEEYLGENAATPTRKQRVRAWFSRSNAKRFLWAAILLLLTSLLSPFPYYYILFSGVLLLSSLLIRIFGYE